jgi:hypothetical protein
MLLLPVGFSYEGAQSGTCLSCSMVCLQDLETDEHTVGSQEICGEWFARDTHLALRKLLTKAVTNKYTVQWNENVLSIKPEQTLVSFTISNQNGTVNASAHVTTIGQNPISLCSLVLSQASDQARCLSGSPFQIPLRGCLSIFGQI